MNTKIKSMGHSLIILVSILVLLSISIGTVFAQDKQPPSRPQPVEPVQPLKGAFNAPLLQTQSNIGNITLNWSTCGSCPQQTEVGVTGNSINLGVADRPEYAYQNMAKHGVAALLPASSKYTISFDFKLYTWDSYNPAILNFSGYWDSLSVSVSNQPYWQLSLGDPVTKTNLPGLGFITGGSIWGQGIRQYYGGSKTIVVNGNLSGSNYLNVILDTATYPNADNAYPSWATVTIKDIKTTSDLQSYAAHAATIAPAVVGGAYLWGGQGFDWKLDPKQFVNSQPILDGYNYLVYDPATKKSTIELGKGLDCAGLVLWAYNKDVSPTDRFGGLISVEGADAIYNNNTEEVAEANLLPGDLLFFGWTDDKKVNHMTHVAMFIGGSDSSKNVVEAANPTAGIVYSSKDVRKKDAKFLAFRRVVSSQLPFAVKIHSPATLVVTDPDGNTITADTTIITEEEQLHEIPGELYYLRDDQNGDMVYSPTLKAGEYIIQVIPKPGALPSDTFSLDVTGAGKYVELAQNVPIGQIPDQPFGVISDGNEIVPSQPTIISTNPPNLTIPLDQTVQYSDPISFTASAIDPDNLASSLKFSANGLPDSITLADNGDGSATISGIAKVSPGTYPISVTVTDPDGLSDTKSLNIIVIPEDAKATYTGSMLVSTSSISVSTATLPLRATIQDITAVDPSGDPNPGDITKATVSFVNRDNGNAVLCTATPVLLDPADSTIATATCNWTANIGSSMGIDYTVGVIVGGYYAHNSSNDNTVVVVSKPTTNFITAGGYLINQASSGKYAGDQSAKTNFGMNIKFTSKLTNLQGRVNLIVRQNGHIYQIKSTALSSLVAIPYNTAKPSTGTAELLTKATIQDITNPLIPISLEGGATLQVVMKDNGEPGDSDTISLSVWGKDGKLLYSSNWTGTKTVPQKLDGGNIQIH